MYKRQIENGRDAVIWFSSDVTIRNNVIRDGRYGLHFMFCDNNTLIGNRMEGNSVAIYLMNSNCLLYTSDAADERSSVDLGGRRIINKKKKHKLCVS